VGDLLVDDGVVQSLRGGIVQLRGFGRGSRQSPAWPDLPSRDRPANPKRTRRAPAPRRARVL